MFNTSRLSPTLFTSQKTCSYYKGFFVLFYCDCVNAHLGSFSTVLLKMMTEI